MQVMVLSDGMTHTGVEGCRIIDVPQEMIDKGNYEDIEKYLEKAYNDEKGILLSEMLTQFNALKDKN